MKLGNRVNVLVCALALCVPATANAGWIGFLSKIQGFCTTASALFDQGQTGMLVDLLSKNPEDVGRCPARVRKYWAEWTSSRSSQPAPQQIATASGAASGANFTSPPALPAPPFQSPSPVVSSIPAGASNIRTYSAGGRTIHCVTIDGKSSCRE